MLVGLNDVILGHLFEFLDLRNNFSLVQTPTRFAEAIAHNYRTHQPIRLPNDDFRNDDELNYYQNLENIAWNARHLELKSIEWDQCMILKDLHFPNIATLTIESCYILNEMSREQKYGYIEFMRNMSATSMSQLKMHKISWNHVCLLRHLKFENVTNLTLDFLKSRSDIPYNEDIGILPSIFPNLEKLKTDTYIDGINLWNFRNLTELCLIKTPTFKDKYFNKIFSELRLKKLGIMLDRVQCCGEEANFTSILECQTLEQIHLDYHYWRLLRNFLPKMRNLKILGFTPREECLCDCSRDQSVFEAVMEFCVLAKKVTFNEICLDEDWSNYIGFIREMKNLRTLIINACCYRSEDLIELAALKMDSLNEFQFTDNFIYRRHEKFQNCLLLLLENCRNLNMFDASQSNCDISFLCKAMDIIKNNNKTFIFQCHQTEIRAQELSEIDVPNQVTVSLEERTCSHPEFSGVELEF